MSGGKTALRALADDLERLETNLRVRAPEFGHIRMETHVDVLVFEDSDEDARQINLILGNDGVKKMARVEDANDWERWVSYFRPRVIVMDVIMPGKNGFEALREIVRHPTLGAIPVVICTSKKTECDYVWALKCGAAGYVTKPLNDPQDLITTVRSAVRNAREGQRLDLVV